MANGGMIFVIWDVVEFIRDMVVVVVQMEKRSRTQKALKSATWNLEPLWKRHNDNGIWNLQNLYLKYLVVIKLKKSKKLKKFELLKKIQKLIKISPKTYWRKIIGNNLFFEIIYFRVTWLLFTGVHSLPTCFT